MHTDEYHYFVIVLYDCHKERYSDLCTIETRIESDGAGSVKQ